MAGPGNFIPDEITSSFEKPAKAPSQTQPVWPEGGLQGLPSTGYPDLATNPSIDTRTLMHNVEVLARKHWWDVPGKQVSTGGEGNGAGSGKPGYAPKYPTVDGSK